MLGGSFRLGLGRFAVEITAPDKSAIVLNLVPVETKKSMLGLEIGDLQDALDLCMQTGPATGERQFGFGQRQVFHFALVVTFGERPEFIIKQLIALQLSKGLGPLALAITQYLRNTAVRGCAPPYGAVPHGLACRPPEWRR